MSINSKVYFDLASLAEAAYSLFSLVDSSEEALDALISGGFSRTQAEDLLSRWSVTPGAHNSGAGYSSTLFEGSEGYVLAFRGTAEFTDDLLSADVSDIVADGIAIHQIIDMVNEWTRITSSGKYGIAKLETLNFETTMLRTTGMAYLPILALRNDVVIDLPSNTVKTIVWENSTANGLGLGNDIAAKGLTVTGHSLGGHLAAAFTRLMPDTGAEAFTVNGAGFGVLGLNAFAGKNVSNLFSLLFGDNKFGGTSVLNVYGEKNPEFITQDALLQQPGASVPIFIEQPGVWDNKLGHSAIAMTDTLAVYDLFFSLDANVPMRDLLSIFNHSSNNAASSLENIVSTLIKIFNAGDPNIVNDDRESLHSHIELVRKSSEFKSIFDKVNVVKDANPLKAKNSFSHFISLYHLAPFVLEGGDVALQKNNPELYSLWSADAALTSEERKNGKANFSDQWYEDRSAMLKALIYRNKEDEVNDTKTNAGDNDILYTDEVNSITLLSEGKSSSETNLIRFGDEKVNDLTGGVSDDHIYGMAGNDKLNGQKGNDILFGGAGEDQLNGGEGADLLFGGTDKDTLDGGEGNDILRGGEGDDTYKFTGNFGRDVIFDTEGSNSLDINGIVSSFTQLAKDSIIYYDDINNPTRKAVLVNEGNTKSLIISTVSKSGLAITDSGNSVTIKNWNGTGFGISLNEAVVLPPDTEKVFTVTANNNDNVLSLDNAQDTDPNYGVIGYKTIKAEGKAGNDLIMGLSTGKDTLLGGDGNDVISSGFTDSVVSSTHIQVLDVPGIDSISGGKGEDYIVASALAVAHGDEDNDVLRSDVALYAVIPGENRDVIWKDIQQFMNYMPEKKETAGVTEYVTGLTFKKNLTAEFQEFASVNGSKFIAKYANGKTTIAYNYSYANGSYTYDSPGLVDIVENNIVPAKGTYDAIGKMQGASLFGDAGDDYLFGGDRSDYLAGGDGKDTIFGGEGQDVIDGGKESDLILGSEGDDLIIGGEGDDTIFGSKGGARAEASDNDVLYGGSGADKIYGGVGRDYIDGGIGLDELRGGDGDDYLYGGDDQEKDFLYGDADNDTIVMGLHDQADGGSGNNIYIWDPYQVASINTQSVNLSGFDNAASDAGVFGDIFGDATNTSTAPRIISDAIYIKNTEGNNTLGIAGVSSLNDAAINISGDYLLLTTRGNQELVIEGGVSNTPVQIRFGSTVEQLSNTPIAFSPLTDEHFLNGLAPLEQDQITSADLMLAKLETVAVLTGNANQYLVGGLNNDTLTANLSGSTIIGGKGNDNLIGDVGNDTYLIRKDDGNDTLIEKGGDNHIKFDRNISVAQTTVRRNGTDLVFTFSEDQHFTVKSMFNAQGALIAANSIKDVTFYAGALGSEVWDLTLLKQHALASTVADDIITGFDGDDIYYYSLGGGRDVITDAQGNDTIQLGEGIKKDQVIVRKDVNNNLILSFRDGGSVTVANAFNSSGAFTGNVIESIKFADNSIWNLTQLQAEVLKDQAQTLTGTDHDEVLTGSAAKDVLVGNKGNDRLVGGAANDIYQYALGDGNDLIVDTNGIDSIRFTNITQSDVIARSNGKDLTLTLADGAVLTVNDMFVTKIPNVVDPLITSILNQIETRWISQAETLIENHFGLVGGGDLELNFGRNIAGGHVANISFKTSTDGLSLVPVLTIDLDDFAEMPNGSAPYYYDRLITHEMTHVVMARNMSIGTLPGWFLEGTAEFIQGADERVKFDLNLINSQSNFEALFKTTVGSPSTSAGYSVSYIAVKFLDNEIRKNGGIGIREVFDQLKIGKTLSQSLAIVSSAHGGMGGMWSTLSSFEAYFKAVGFSSFDSLLSLNNADTGSIAGSDYGNAPLDAKSVVADTNSGSSKHFNLVIPTQFIAVGDEHNEIETIQFSDGSIWNMERIQQEIIKGNLIATDRNDFIVGTQGNDNLQGYKGDDHLSGGLGNDVYSYTLGDGKDFIVDAAGINELQLSGIAGNQVKTTRDSSNNLVLTFVDGGAITIADAFDSYGSLKADRITTVKFSDGSVWDSTRIRQESLRMPGVTLTAPATGEFSGTGEDDTLIAGVNNKLYGIYGNDTYLINAGGEYYVIEDNYGANTLQFGAGITKDQLRFTRDWIGTNLHISVNGQDYVSVRYMFTGIYTSGEYANNYPTPAIEYIRFENGEQLSLQDIKRELLLPTDGDDTLYGYETNDLIIGQAGDDLINGFSGHDVLSGGSGNDYLSGGEGNDILDSGKGNYDRSEGGAGDDTFIYNQGDGHSEIADESGFDVLLLGEGITRDRITFSARYQSNYSRYDYQLNIEFDELNVIEIKGLFAFDKVAPFIVERSSIDVIRFANNDELSLSDLKNILLTSTEGDDYLTGFYTNESFHGGAGNDEFCDPMGDDQYFYELGDGKDIIYDEDGNDVILFGEGIAREDVSFYRLNTDLMVSLNDGGSIRISDVYSDSYSQNIRSHLLIESFRFADDSQLSFSQAISQLTSAPPTATFNYHGDIISGITDPDNTVIAKNASGVVLGSAIADAFTGEYFITLAVPLIDKEAVNINSINLAGRSSRATSIVAPDLTAPLQPTATINSLGSIVSGVSEIGSTVIATDVYGSQLGVATADVATGAYTISLLVPLTNKEIICVKAADLFGNISSITTINAPDFTAPALPTAAINSIGTIVSGIAEANSTVIVKNMSGMQLGSVVANVDGAYSITLTSPLINKETVNVTATDTAGNISPVRAIIAPDKTAPAIPTAAFDNTGKIINGIAEVGSTVIVKNTSGSQLGTAVANATTGAYTITLSTALTNKQTVNVTAKDAAGNISSTRAVVAPDLIAPTVPSASIDTTGKIITGTAEKGSTVIIKNAAGTELKTGMANASTGAYSITLTTAMINKESLSVTARDGAGNISPVRVIIAPDKTAPAAPTATFDTAGKVITGVAEAGSTVSVKNAAGTELKTATANTSTGAYTITLTTALINKETVNVTAKDAAGNISAIKSLIAPDKTPPAAPTASLDTTRKIITGNAEAGSIVEVKNVSNQSLGSVTANATTGVYTISLSTALAVNQVVNVTAKDAAGNISPIKSITAPPAAKATFADISYENLQMGPRRLFGLLVQPDSSNTQSELGKNSLDSWFGSPSERVTHNLVARDQPIKPHAQQLGTLIQSMAAFAPSSGVEQHLSERSVNNSVLLLAVGT